VSEPHVPVEDTRPEAPPPRARARAHRRADLALVLAAFAFGTTFIVVQDAVEGADPTGFLAARFLLGGAVLAVVARRRRRRAPHELRHGIAAGLALTVGYISQTVGLQYTTAATSAFLTYMLVVVVPLAGWVALGRRPHPLTTVGVALAVAGLALLTGGGGTGFGRGEVLTLVCAVAFAIHIVILGEVASRHDAVRLTCVQLLTVGGVCLVPALVTGGLALPADAVGAAVFTGVFATALAFLAMVAAQRIVSPARAALVLLLEPVFAAILDGLTGAPVRASTAAGGALILVAVVVAEVLPETLATRRAARSGVGVGPKVAVGAEDAGRGAKDNAGIQGAKGSGGGAGAGDAPGPADTDGGAGAEGAAGDRDGDAAGPEGGAGADTDEAAGAGGEGEAGDRGRAGDGDEDAAGPKDATRADEGTRYAAGANGGACAGTEDRAGADRRAGDGGPPTAVRD
jgi:drug/metabolite transporter (DMT)-like permease